MKKAATVFAVMVLFLVVSDCAFAKDFWLSDSTGNEKGTFKRNEIPWVNVDLKKKDSSILGWWGSEGNQNTISESGFIRGSSIKLSLADSNWPALQKVDSYNIHLNGYGTLHATVTPEPIGAALFALGAGALGIIKRRRGKTKHKAM